MARHSKTVPISLPRRKKNRGGTSIQHDREIRSASSEITRNVCPNDRALLVDGRCETCGFWLSILPPPPISHRVPFHRQWWPAHRRV